MGKDTSLRQKRDAELYSVYLRGLRECSFSSETEAVDWVRSQSASEFYVSPKALVNYICTIRKGSTPSKMYSWNEKKITLLYQMYLNYMEQHPTTTRSTILICEELVESPAPCFFIGREIARRIIKKEIAKHRIIYHG